MHLPIKVGMLISYDYELARNALPLLYKNADSITLAIDKNRKTWSGGSFSIDESFFEWVKALDVDKKIQYYEDDFFDPTLNPMQNDTRERNMLAKFMGPGGWHVQIDADEYMIDFEKFVSFLRTGVSEYQNLDKPICVYTELVTLYKQADEGFLYIPSHETGPVATLHPNYVSSRYTTYNRLVTNFKMIHQSWARSEQEIKEKIGNWGHRDDFNTESYLNFWKACDQYNFKFYNHFHPIYEELWHSLDYIQCDSIPEFISKYSVLNDLTHKKITGDYARVDSERKERKKKWYKRIF